MSNQRLSQLVELSPVDVATNDLLYIVDTSERTSKKIEIGDFVNFFAYSSSINSVDTASYLKYSGNYNGTASHAITSDSSISSSWADNCNYAAQAGNVTNASYAGVAGVADSLTQPNTTTASHATTAEYSISASYLSGSTSIVNNSAIVISAYNRGTIDEIVSGSSYISGSETIHGNLYFKQISNISDNRDKGIQYFKYRNNLGVGTGNRLLRLQAPGTIGGRGYNVGSYQIVQSVRNTGGKIGFQSYIINIFSNYFPAFVENGPPPIYLTASFVSGQPVVSNIIYGTDAAGTWNSINETYINGNNPQYYNSYINNNVRITGSCIPTNTYVKSGSFIYNGGQVYCSMSQNSTATTTISNSVSGNTINGPYIWPSTNGFNVEIIPINVLPNQQFRLISNENWWYQAAGISGPNGSKLQLEIPLSSTGSADYSNDNSYTEVCVFELLNNNHMDAEEYINPTFDIINSNQSSSVYTLIPDNFITFNNNNFGRMNIFNNSVGNNSLNVENIFKVNNYTGSSATGSINFNVPILGNASSSIGTGSMCFYSGSVRYEIPVYRYS